MSFYLPDTVVHCADGQSRTLLEVLWIGQKTYLGGKDARFPPGLQIIRAAVPSEPVHIVRAHPLGGFSIHTLDEHATHNNLLHTAARPIEWYPIQSFPDLEQARAYQLTLKRARKEARQKQAITPSSQGSEA